MNEKNVI